VGEYKAEPLLGRRNEIHFGDIKCQIDTFHYLM
jgi:hypothetical protein